MVHRVTQVIEGIAATPGGATVTELAPRLRMSRQAVVRVLDDLVATGVVLKEKDSRRYFLTLKWYQWTSQAAARYLPRPAIRQEMALLAEEIRLPVFYAVMEDTSVMLLERTEQAGDSVITIPYSTRNPWSGTSSGMSIVAFSAPARIQQLLALEASDGTAGRPVAQIETELAEIRRRGYAERNVDGRRYTLCAPIIDQSGYAAAGLSVAVFLNREDQIDREQVAEVLRESAARCSGHLGYAVTTIVP